MLKTILVLATAAAAITPLKLNEKGRTMRQWIENTQCLNVASQPLMNTQFAQLGAMDALNDAGLMNKVTGMSGVSSGAFVTALAATKDFSENSRKFRQVWPGWDGLVPEGGMSDPALSQHYEQKILKEVLPASFEELKIPIAIVATAYDTEDAAKNLDLPSAHPMVLSDGSLSEAVIVSSSAMVGPGCPNCQMGFKAKEVRGQWPVADGFLVDEYGTMGLAALAPCPNLLHIQPTNFAQQLTPTKNSDIDTQPKSVVTLGIDVPSSGIMSLVNPMKFIGSKEKKDEIWEKLEYENAYDHMKELLDQPMQVVEGDDEEHYFVDLELAKHYDGVRGWMEKLTDSSGDKAHTEYWQRTIPRRNEMVSERALKLASGELSYRACGNGLGAPKCNALKQKIPSGW